MSREQFNNWLNNFLSRFDVLQYATGLSIIFLMLSVAYSIMFREVPEANKELFIHLIGIVEGSFVGGLVGYYFGKAKIDKP